MIDVYLNISLLLCLMCLFLIKRRVLTLEQKIIGLLVTVTLPFELYAGYLQSFNSNNLFVYHLLIPIQYCFYAYLYFYFIEFKIIKKLILFSIALVITAAVVLAFTIQPLNNYNSYVIILSNLLLCIWVLSYYRQLFVHLTIVNLNQEPLFWISTGLLFFALGDFFVEGLMKALLEQSPEMARWYYYNIYVPVLCLLYVLFIISFICRDIFKKKPISY
ncbi:hypothetical protein [Adhaeribacter pallidiroseus]|uniref:Uncharacterized protein n=1 Tax=Adhaeribacter pallidiroseus TaxID=2072847 RepID=A0A369QHV5_9BACT|nr:hypothetical protein [Adhaeribacter pallidiroseus]RDC62867.1 hypothetical protein AHMF7616_01466 [Adhaeribacter pallidiroseus]